MNKKKSPGATPDISFVARVVDRDTMAIKVFGTHTHEEGTEYKHLHEGRSDGQYIAWHWDGETLVACNDPLGFYPLFYSGNKHEVVVGTSPAAVLQHGVDAKLDATALATFFFLGFYLGNDTPFSKIKVLPPHGKLIWRAGSLTVTGGYWAQPLSDDNACIATDRFIELARQAVKRRLPAEEQTWGMPLSGGRDSRYILYELLEQSKRPSCVITTRQYPPRTAIDAEVASRLSTHLGLKHIIINPTHRLTAEYRKNLATHFMADEHAWFVGVADVLKQKVSCSYDGVGGDTLTGHWLRMPWRSAYEAGKIDEVTEMLTDKSYVRSYPELPDLTLPELDDVREYITRELRIHASHHNPITQFMFWNRTRREISTMSCGLLRGLTVHCPFIDTDLYSYLSSLIPSAMGVSELHDRAFEKAHPNFSAIPLSPYGTKCGDLLHYSRFAWDLASYIFTSKSGGLLSALQFLTSITSAGLSFQERKRLALKSPSRVLYRFQLNELRMSASQKK
jgi:hypothetical protein